jgi:hypothetical protein
MSIGRNDPCPCGSGLKYKRCCQIKDQKEQIHQPTDASRLIPSPGGAGKGWPAQQAKQDAARAHRDAQRELEQARAASKKQD